jgi:hypothetical protein
MGGVNADIAIKIAKAIRLAIDAKASERVSKAQLTTSYALHVALEAIAVSLEVDKRWFKDECGVGQPLAYFVS